MCPMLCLLNAASVQSAMLDCLFVNHVYLSGCRAQACPMSFCAPFTLCLVVQFRRCHDPFQLFGGEGRVVLCDRRLVLQSIPGSGTWSVVCIAI